MIPYFFDLLLFFLTNIPSIGTSNVWYIELLIVTYRQLLFEKTNPTNNNNENKINIIIKTIDPSLQSEIKSISTH